MQSLDLIFKKTKECYVLQVFNCVLINFSYVYTKHIKGLKLLKPYKSITTYLLYVQDIMRMRNSDVIAL